MNDKKPTPKVDLLHLLLQIFSMEQLTRIVEISKRLADHGHGDLTVRFVKGEPRFIGSYQEEWLPKKENTVRVQEEEP